LVLLCSSEHAISQENIFVIFFQSTPLLKTTFALWLWHIGYWLILTNVVDLALQALKYCVND